MVFLLHGSNAVKVNNQLTSLKKQLQEKNTDKVEFDKTNFDPSLIRNGLSSVDFFGNGICVIVNISDLNKSQLDELYDVTTAANANSKLILYAYKTLTKTHPFIKNSEKIKINEAVYENVDNKDIFKLSDGILAGNRLVVYKAIKNLLDDPVDPDPIPIIAYLHTMIRNLLLININSPKAKEINPYVYSKLQPAAKRANLEQLKSLIKNFYNIDIDIKQGRTTPEIALNLITEKILTMFV